MDTAKIRETLTQCHARYFGDGIGQTRCIDALACLADMEERYAAVRHAYAMEAQARATAEAQRDELARAMEREKTLRIECMVFLTEPQKDEAYARATHPYKTDADNG